MSRIDENGQVIATNFAECGLSVVFVKGVESPLGDTYYFDLENPIDYNKRKIMSIVEIIGKYHHARLSFVDTTETHFGVYWAQSQSKLSLLQLMSKTNYREIVIGQDTNGELAKLDFTKIPHLLIAGTTGSGKSVLLHNLICNIYNYYGKNRFLAPKMFIIDPKTSELNQYKECANTYFVDSVSEAINKLNECVDEMNMRYTRMNVKESDMFIIIDELADLMLSSRFEVEESIVKLAQKGRACGIHLIVATQRPTIDVCSGLIKANMPYRIALKTASVRDSVVILDHKGAEELVGNGDCIIKFGLSERHVQIAYPEIELRDKICQVYKWGWK